MRPFCSFIDKNIIQGGSEWFQEIVGHLFSVTVEHLSPSSKGPFCSTQLQAIYSLTSRGPSGNGKTKITGYCR